MLARDDRSWQGDAPLAVVYNYAPGRGAEHAVALLRGFAGVLQIDGYAAYRSLADPKRTSGRPRSRSVGHIGAGSGTEHASTGMTKSLPRGAQELPAMHYPDKLHRPSIGAIGRVSIQSAKSAKVGQNSTGVDKGRRGEARDLLVPLYGWFSEGLDTADLRDAKALLDQLA